MPNIFTPPVATHRAHPLSWGHASAKRKRQKSAGEMAQDDEDEDEDTLEDVKVLPGKNLEYTAVVTPLERHQRQRAGQPLDEKPPRHPFPHALAKDGDARQTSQAKKTDFKTPPLRGNTQSLHMQHLAALTAIIHRSLLQEDFPRASRALSLLFREDAVSNNAAVRNQGYMGIAAEVLLRNGSSRNPAPRSTSTCLPFTHEGFERAKRLYERLIVRHPYHKTWPNAVNAVDFYLAMFNLWIYVVHTENATLPDKDEDLEHDAEASRKVRELEQANQIVGRLDTCMATIPYMDEPELIRLRAMTALWTADLHEDCALLDQVSDIFQDQKGPARPLEEDVTSGENEHLRDARLARDKAQQLLSKLEGRATSDDG